MSKKATFAVCAVGNLMVAIVGATYCETELAWSAWSPCYAECGAGVRQRTETCGVDCANSLCDVTDYRLQCCLAFHSCDGCGNKDVAIASFFRQDFELQNDRFLSQEQVLNILYGSGRSEIFMFRNLAIEVYKTGRDIFTLQRSCFITDARTVRITLEYANGNTKILKFKEAVQRCVCLSDSDTNRDVRSLVYKIANDGNPFLIKDFYIEGCVTATPIDDATSVPVPVPIDPPIPPCGFSPYAEAGAEGGHNIPQANVVGGWQALPGEFPWMVHLGKCAGVIIDKYYILTVAHCVVEYDGSEKDIEIVIGEHDLGSTSGHEQTLLHEQIIAHENYSDHLNYNDIALIRLKDPGIVDWENVGKLCMPSKTTTDIEGTMMTVAGWGHTAYYGDDTNTEILRYTTGLPLMLSQDCDTCINDYWNQMVPGRRDKILDGMICAGFCGFNARDACRGDSGAPLLYKSANGAWELRGLVAWGFGCASETPGVYVDVYFHRQWIQQNTMGAESELFV